MKLHQLCNGAVGRSCAKVILTGEHAAVYGFPAIALALTSLSLTLNITNTPVDSWENAWQINIQNQSFPLNSQIKGIFLKVFEKAFSFFFPQKDIREVTPAAITINTSIPIGSGLGSSAAISVALIKALSSATGTTLSLPELIARANALDMIFHGKSSGLDVSTIAMNQAIEFSKTSSPRPVKISKDFFIALVDSGERTSTEQMVQMVLDKKRANPDFVETNCLEIGKCTSAALQALAAGELQALGHALNTSHVCLQNLGISTTKLDTLISAMRESGAIGAKVTGGGGGGMALGIFTENPAPLLAKLFPNTFVFTDKISQGGSSDA